MSLISVITPAYNAEKYISETIESVLNQTFTDWEMIIVDDCSGDLTFDIASSYAEKDRRIKVIRHVNNKGVSTARNTALEAASSDYIAFLDSDDIWLPEKLEKQYSFMESNKYAFTYTMYQSFKSQNRTGGKIINVPKYMTYNKIFKNTSIACLTVMVNRKITGEFYMPLLQHTEDQCTWQDILKRGYKAYALQENLALYRESESSLTGNKKRAMQKQWHTYRNYYKFSIIKSGYYFSCYAINAVAKHFL